MKTKITVLLFASLAMINAEDMPKIELTRAYQPMGDFKMPRVKCISLRYFRA